MTIRTMPGVAAMLCWAAFHASPAAADQPGCAALATWVQAGVEAAAREHGPADLAYGSAGGRGVQLTQLPAGRYTCGETAAVASRAFSAALRPMNLRLGWNGNWMRPGDYCLSHDVGECYPSHDRFSPLPRPANFAFAHRTWARVTRALASQMPYGTGGDLASFSGASLETALSAELQTSLVAHPAARADRRRLD